MHESRSYAARVAWNCAARDGAAVSTRRTPAGCTPASASTKAPDTHAQEGEEIRCLEPLAPADLERRVADPYPEAPLDPGQVRRRITRLGRPQDLAQSPLTLPEHDRFVHAGDGVGQRDEASDRHGTARRRLRPRADQQAWCAHTLVGERGHERTRPGRKTMMLAHDGCHGAGFHLKDPVQVAELVPPSTGERAGSGYADDARIGPQVGHGAPGKGCMRTASGACPAYESAPPPLILMRHHVHGNAKCRRRN